MYLYGYDCVIYSYFKKHFNIAQKSEKFPAVIRSDCSSTSGTGNVEQTSDMFISFDLRFRIELFWKYHCVEYMYHYDSTFHISRISLVPRASIVFPSIMFHTIKFILLQWHSIIIVTNNCLLFLEIGQARLS